MKNSTKLFGGAFTLAIAATAIASPSLAYRGDLSAQGPDCSEERHEVMEKAFQDNDHEAWKELMSGKGRVIQAVNTDNFARFAEAHKLAEEGNFEEAKAIRAELGLSLRDGSGKGQGQRENGREKGFERDNRSGLKDGNGQRGNANFYSRNN
ncbi:MAG: hypothetical protein KAQ64_05280 [Candidatus Pacebacteria bacterium]|nr:hypothetical protein [Candidatus Paceibacterota bacterium]